MNRAQLRLLVERGSRRARSLSRILERPEWLLSTTLVGTTLATMTVSAVATLYVETKFGDRHEWLAYFATAPLMLLFGEVLPKTMFQRFSNRLAPQLVFPLYTISFFLSPIVFFVSSVARIVTRISGIHSRKKTPLMTREELELLLQASERNQMIGDDKRKMIDRIFSLSDRRARDIMIPLVDVVGVRETATISEAEEILRKNGFSRVPVFAGRAYNIVGWLNHYDLLGAKEKMRVVSEIMRKVRFVPASVRIDKLLFEMQRAAETIAIVVDEYGGAIGLVTFEDVIEEVVGEIEDESDVGSQFVKRVSASRLVVNARVPIHQLNDFLSNKIPTGEYETLGGFLQARLQRIPRKGEELRLKNITFKVLTANDRTVEEVEVAIPDDAN